MKKRVLYAISIIFLMIAFSFVVAQDEDLSVEDKGYQCLREKVDDRTCDSLTTQEKIFSLLSTGECKDELVADSQGSGQCWPATSCDLKTTAQAVLALDNANYGTSEAEVWLLSQNKTTTELKWYLQIESSLPISCDIVYEAATGVDVTATVTFGEDKKIASISRRDCFTSSVGDYWLGISGSCYDKEFRTTCNESFLTTLLYQENEPEAPIYVSGNTQSGGETIERVNSYCFKKGVSCNYEGSLWASLVLDSLGEDMNPYWPYLVTLEDENENYLPEAFLWHLIGDTAFYNELLDKQTSFGGDYFWQTSGEGRHYDTALALYSMQYDESQEKTNAIEWVKESQEEDGCWNHGNIRDTAFVLYSIWPRGVSGSGDGNGDGTPDCEVAGYHCMSGMSCLTEAGGSILDDYNCAAGFVCCTQELVLDSCYDQGGIICVAGDVCQGGEFSQASDLLTAQECCIGGTCVTPSPGDGEENTCEENDGICRVYGCNDDEQESFSYTCEFGDESCCFPSSEPAPTTGKRSYTWIIILVILIIIVVIAIMFREQLKRLWFRTKSGVGRRRLGPGPGYPPPAPLTGGHPQRMPMPREMPRGPPPAMMRRRRPARSQGELGDVLKKLKDMGR